MENMRLVQKVAWSFHKSTGLPVDELVSEAALAYAECLPIYDPKKAQLSTHAYTHMRNHLCSWSRLQKKQIPTSDIDDLDEKDICSCSGQNRTIFKDCLQNSSKEIQFVANMIFESPAEFLGVGGKGRIKDELRKTGWTWDMIWNTFAEVKNLLKEITV